MGDSTQQAGNNRRIDQIVELAAKGLTDKQISQTLNISKHTVETHWLRLREKLGVTNRTAAVIAVLRETVELQNQELRATNAALQSFHAASRTGMTTLLADVQKRLAEYQARDKHLDFFERASHLAHVVAYELESVDPVVHRYLSPSATLFGIDVAALQQTCQTFYDLVYEEDLPLIYEKSLGATWAADERYVYIYRFKMPQPRWILDTQQALYDSEGRFQSVIGIAIDIHELVLAGAIPAAVIRLVIPSAPVC